MKYYERGWKYELAEDTDFQTQIFPEHTITTDFIQLRPDGLLTLCRGYAWDGASGPTIDSDSSMRGSAVHDALYQLMKLGLLDLDWFTESNRELRRWLKLDGMSFVRRWAWYHAVQQFGRGHMFREHDDQKLYEAP
jgi:hypothetical protein